MAFLGIFGKKSDESSLRKHAERVANKRAQQYDRWESIQALAQLRTKESAAALLPRFTFYIEPSISDQDEKDAAFQGIVDAGEAALEPVLAYLKRAESVSWPLKMLDKIVAPEAVVGHLLEVLDGMDIEYARDPESKIQILTTLAERKDPRVPDAIARFLGDANESARFAAVGAIIGQEGVLEHKTALVNTVCVEDSVRVRNRIFEALSVANLGVQPEQERVKARLTPNYVLDAGFVPRKKA
ncbi:MAG: HEAT repeat domain-containing protein [Polyangiales bacterium]